MNQEIINYLKSDRSFEAGKNLYIRLGNSKSFMTSLNRQGYSKYNYDLLLEELRKIAGLSPLVFKQMLSQPVVNVSLASSPVADLPQVPATVNEIPLEVLKFIRLRDEFPFLKKDDCPYELKILVADRITAYHEYVAAHEELFTAENEEQLQQATESVVENYLENNEIFEELNFYKDNGKLLGKHPVFKQVDRMREIRAMATPDLVRLKKSLENNIARNKQKVTEQPDHKETGARQDRIAEYQAELNEVDRLLGFNA